MDLEKLAEASHQAWFVAMAKQGWIFGPRLNPDFKTHPWLKPYPGLSDSAKEIVRAQVRGTLAALESAGGVTGLKAMPAAKPAPAPTPEAPAPQPVARPAAPPPAPAAPTPVASAPATSGADIQVLDRKTDASGRMRIGAGLVKKAELLPGGASQVAILQEGTTIEVVPADRGTPDAFYAAVNPDGFMLPKAMLANTGAKEFTLILRRGSLVVKPKG